MVKGQFRLVFRSKEEMLSFFEITGISKYWYEITIERDFIAYVYSPVLVVGFAKMFRDVYPDLPVRLLC